MQILRRLSVPAEKPAAALPKSPATAQLDHAEVDNA